MKSVRMKYHEGVVYQLNSVNGVISRFKCMEVYEDNYGGCVTYSALMINIASGWRFIAVGTRMFEDGTIEWDYSRDGEFVKMEV